MAKTLTITGLSADHEVPIIRIYALDDKPCEAVVLTGTDHSDHELWHVKTNGTVSLVGTLTEPEYKRMRRAKQLNVYGDSSFEWTNKAHPVFNGKEVLVGHVTKDLALGLSPYKADAHLEVGTLHEELVASNHPSMSTS